MDYPTLDAEQLETLEALTTHATKTEAASALGISRASLYRRLESEDLREAYESLRHRKRDDALDLSINAAEGAMLVLMSICHDESVPASVRVQAANKIWDAFTRGTELRDVMAEIEELKQTVGVN
jgi:regulatory Fis family protein